MRRVDVGGEYGKGIWEKGFRNMRMGNMEKWNTVIGGET
jgi:hypothetical protein